MDREPEGACATLNHDWCSQQYVDSWIDGDVTRDTYRRSLLRRATSLLPFDTDAPIRVLDVGGGYGEFSGQVLEAFPASTVTLHDFSEAMITRARERLASHGNRVAYVRSDLRLPEWVDGIEGRFDAVVSSLAVHNLRDADAVRRVYAGVFGLLRPGGCFLNFDLLFPPLSLAGGYERSREASEGDLRGVITQAGNGHRAEPGHDPAAPDVAGGVEDHLRWLRAAGFEVVDCVWKEFETTLLCGLRLG